MFEPWPEDAPQSRRERYLAAFHSIDEDAPQAAALLDAGEDVGPRRPDRTLRPHGRLGGVDCRVRSIEAGSQSVLVIITLGLIIPPTVNDFDVSIASMTTFSSMTIAVLNVSHQVPIGWAIVVALASG